MIENIRIIKHNEDTEWRSQRDFLNYVRNNTILEKHVVGYITVKTLEKWGIVLDIGKVFVNYEFKYMFGMFWLIVEGNRYWLKPKWV